VAVAAWAVPGLGHWILRERTRAIIFFVTIAMTFWGGVAIGGVRSTIDPQTRKFWFMAQVCSGGHALVALAWAGRYELNPDQYSIYRAVWPADDIAVVYTGVAGLLNLLIVLDALGRLEVVPELPNGRRAGPRGGPREGAPR